MPRREPEIPRDQSAQHRCEYSRHPSANQRADHHRWKQRDVWNADVWIDQLANDDREQKNGRGKRIPDGSILVLPKHPNQLDNVHRLSRWILAQQSNTSFVFQIVAFDLIGAFFWRCSIACRA